jgi:hypothetical protein
MRITLSSEIPRYFIYGLRDPRTGEIRYVGQSSRGMERPIHHNKPSNLKKLPHLHVNRWISKLHSLGLKYEIVLLERFDGPEHLDIAEIRWIALGRDALGERLANATYGGGGTRGWHHTAESRKKLKMAASTAESVAKRSTLKRTGKCLIENGSFRIKRYPKLRNE